MKLRNLKPEEIRVRHFANAGGVKLSLWKVPMANLDIIDDAVGIENRSIAYSDNGKRCTISIRENGEWRSNDGYAFEGSPDNEPNDALNHAGLAWGIGKELFHTPEMFIYKDKLNGFKHEENTEPVCYDEFVVKNISYKNGAVTSVTIAVCKYGKEYARMVFKESANVDKPQSVSEKATNNVAITTVKQETPVAQMPTNGFADDEIILIGNCKGQTYGAAKETETFKSFLEWVKTASRSYTVPEQADQFARFKKLAA